MNSIQVDFLEDSTAIIVHTCSNLLVFLSNAFVDSEDSFADFTAAMKAVISHLSLLTWSSH